MSDHYRRHHASREIIFVPVPYEVGTPRETHRVKPGRYPRDRREAWRPATRPPKLNKAQRMGEFMRRVQQQEEIIREFMKPDANHAQSMAQRDGSLMIVDHDITPVCVTSGFVVG
jgi:hypothetical protein